ncbi:ferric reductase-like transmembrane domain-containing protein [Hyphomicrobium sp. NDB2Meth4]|uniref:ferredoxin reductase family protein n=1 Tax=Hyphomicrobium sp. NDB2Meth4 TaxID=1892846 RepID=UPI000930603A|nr:ferric reductase-like transmembrane domain-containing protein [Hyphomicrobium sp. NDB2Meth4]
MHKIKRALILILAICAAVWLIADPWAFKEAAGLFEVRRPAIQLSGFLAIALMSVAMLLALRPRSVEPHLGGLDKMYRLHKWLGISALVVGIVHFLWAKGPKWAVGWGLLERPMRGPRPPIDNPVEQFLAGMRGAAEGLGEWAFYAAVLLIALALIKRFPYWIFYKTHRLLAVAYLVLVFHSVVLLKFSYWASPIGIVLIPLLAGGVYAAVVVLLRRVGSDRQIEGKIASLQYYPGVRALETRIDVPDGWPGHKPGQFAFATSDPSEGPHPYTIASEWTASSRHITFITKELGDHTRRLRDKLRVGQSVKLEGPYGCFTFEDDLKRQIWIGGGVGITPFIAKMKHRAVSAGTSPAGPEVDLFHASAEYDEVAFEKLKADAAAANVRLHILLDARDGLLSGERIRAEVPQWREASIWFCGPPGFGEALRQDFAAQGLNAATQFHQELFAMR